jgi:hypothetical protein
MDGAPAPTMARLGITPARNWTSTTPGSWAPPPPAPPGGPKRGSSSVISEAASCGIGIDSGPAAMLGALSAGPAPGRGMPSALPASPMDGVGIPPVSAGRAPGVPNEAGIGMPLLSS